MSSIALRRSASDIRAESYDLASKSSRIIIGNTEGEWPLPRISSRVHLLDGSHLLVASSAPKKSDEYQINVHPYGGNRFAMTVDSTMTVANIKDKLKQDKNFVSAPSQRLFFNGWELPDSVFICTIVSQNHTVALVPSANELISFFLISVDTSSCSNSSPSPALILDSNVDFGELTNHQENIFPKLHSILETTTDSNQILDSIIKTSLVPLTSSPVSNSVSTISPSSQLTTSSHPQTNRSQLFLVLRDPNEQDQKQNLKEQIAPKPEKPSIDVQTQSIVKDLESIPSSSSIAIPSPGHPPSLDQVLKIKSSSPVGRSNPYQRIVENEEVISMVRGALDGLSSGQYPELIQDCTGGTYFVKNGLGEKIGIFKPIDEEPYAPANPKGLIGSHMNSSSPLKTSIAVGQAGIRECACYLLDSDSFIGVPETVMLRVLRTSFDAAALKLEMKTGSFQRFIPHKCLAEELSPTCFSVQDVQKIAIFDIRTLNCDRHAGNLLVLDQECKEENSPVVSSQTIDSPQENSWRKRSNFFSTEIKKSRQKTYPIVPIDHGYALPDWQRLDGESINQEWLFWPQVTEPIDPTCLEYIESLNPEADAAMLRMTLPSLPEHCIQALYVGTTLLKFFVLQHKWSLHDVGMLFFSSTDGTSTLERVLRIVKQRLTALWTELTDSSFCAPDLSSIPLSSGFYVCFVQILLDVLDEHVIQKPKGPD